MIVAITVLTPATHGDWTAEAADERRRCTNDPSNGVCVGRHDHRLVEPGLRSVTDPHSRETIAQLRGMSEAT